MADGSEQNTHRGTPLGDDAFADATYQPGQFFSAENGEWTTAQERYGDAGTQGQWSTPSTWDVWTDTSGRYDQWTPSPEWRNDVGAGESLIPVWGSGKQAYYDFTYGNYVTGSANVVNAITDILLVRSLAKAAIKGGGKLLATEVGEAASRWAGRNAKPIGIAAAASVGTGIYDPTGLFDAQNAEAGKLNLLVNTAKELMATAKEASAAINLTKASASRGRSYITYVLRDAEEEVRYIGRASGKGNPIQVLASRLRKGHDVFDLGGLTESVYSTHKTYGAMRGAEQYFYKQIENSGASVLNKIAPIGFDRVSRAEKGVRYLRKFLGE